MPLLKSTFKTVLFSAALFCVNEPTGLHANEVSPSLLESRTVSLSQIAERVNEGDLVADGYFIMGGGAGWVYYSVSQEILYWWGNTSDKGVYETISGSIIPNSSNGVVGFYNLSYENGGSYNSAIQETIYDLNGEKEIGGYFFNTSLADENNNNLPIWVYYDPSDKSFWKYPNSSSDDYEQLDGVEVSFNMETGELTSSSESSICGTPGAPACKCGVPGYPDCEETDSTSSSYSTDYGTSSSSDPYSEPGAQCGENYYYDCAENCVDMWTLEGWKGDNYCDDGSYGINLYCSYYDYDAGDCSGNESTYSTSTTSASYSSSYGAYISGSCGYNMVYDCALNCVDQSYTDSYQGDNYCDDGEYGYYLNCSEFNYDGGDCGANCVTDPFGNVFGCTTEAASAIQHTHTVNGTTWISPTEEQCENYDGSFSMEGSNSNVPSCRASLTTAENICTSLNATVASSSDISDVASGSESYLESIGFFKSYYMVSNGTSQTQWSVWEEWFPGGDGDYGYFRCVQQ